MKQILQILILEDDKDDAFLIQSFLRTTDLVFHSQVVKNKQEYQDALEQKEYHLILSDHRMHNFTSLEALRIRNEKGIFAPFILITGTISEEFAIAILKEGASDYILKDRMQRLPVAIKEALEKERTTLEKLNAEKALSKANERFEKAAQAVSDVIWDYDFAAKKLYCSNSFTILFGYESGECLNPLAIIKRIHHEDAPEVIRSYRAFLKEGKERWKCFCRMHKSEGSVVYVKISAISLSNEEKHPQRIIGVIQDTTEMKRLQDRLLEKEVEKQKYIAAITLKAQEKEREEIGKELHDNINQLLASAKMMMEIASHRQSMRKECISRGKEAVTEAIKEIRRLTHNLMPPSFDETSFAMAIEEIGYKINLHGKLQMKTELPVKQNISLIPNEMKLAIYRIIQEQVHNIIKHSLATEASVTLEILKNHIQLIIADNGIGFDPLKKATGIGLANISSRIESFNGSSQILSEPGNGCTFKIKIPLVKAGELVY
jgi:two-component system, NarL family, sensor histidine kinase UhpB